jgi:hypothetical protein
MGFCVAGPSWTFSNCQLLPEQFTRLACPFLGRVWDFFWTGVPGTRKGPLLARTADQGLLMDGTKRCWGDSGYYQEAFSGTGSGCQSYFVSMLEQFLGSQSTKPRKCGREVARFNPSAIFLA